MVMVTPPLFVASPEAKVSPVECNARHGDAPEKPYEMYGDERAVPRNKAVRRLERPKNVNPALRRDLRDFLGSPT